MNQPELQHIYDKFKDLYPLTSEKNKLPDLLETLILELHRKTNSGEDARFGKLSQPDEYADYIEKYSYLPDEGTDPTKLSMQMVDDLFEGVLRWRSPNLQHNVGSPVNSVASAMYSLALDENIYSIDDGLAGNALVAEKAVVNILSTLACLDKPGAGFFVFGGTATNLYASKIGLQKAYPKTSSNGAPRNVKMFVTEEAHFTHRLSADWLGIGTDNVVEIVAKHPDRTSNIQDAEKKMRTAIENGDIISSIMLNGGSTYSHVVDHITEFVRLRDKLVEEYKLDYRPHIHVDAVIGWTWLFFSGYDFALNPLGITPKALQRIKQQYRAIAGLKYADSWGVDFHKGVGGCPVDCSVIMINNPEDLLAISKTVDTNLTTHQLATELSNYAPSEFTLETSRSGGTGLAALATLQTLGREGYQRNLANLIESTCVLRDVLKKESDVRIANDYSLGFSTMARIYPPELSLTGYPDHELTSDDTSPETIKDVNAYIKAFYMWDFKTRIAKNNGPSPSFSSSFITHNGTKVSALKYYPTSPHYGIAYAIDSAKVLIDQKHKFDLYVWQQKKD